jgi:hypothetical protein
LNPGWLPRCWRSLSKLTCQRRSLWDGSAHTAHKSKVARTSLRRSDNAPKSSLSESLRDGGGDRVAAGIDLQVRTARRFQNVTRADHGRSPSLADEHCELSTRQTARRALSKNATQASFGLSAVIAGPARDTRYRFRARASVRRRSRTGVATCRHPAVAVGPVRSTSPAQPGRRAGARYRSRADRGVEGRNSGRARCRWRAVVAVGAVLVLQLDQVQAQAVQGRIAFDLIRIKQTSVRVEGHEFFSRVIERYSIDTGRYVDTTLRAA